MPSSVSFFFAMTERNYCLFHRFEYHFEIELDEEEEEEEEEEDDD